VSALRASDLDPERLKARGAVMLRDFLAYAETGGRRSDDGTLFAANPPTGDPLRRDLAERLRREGLTVHEDYGSARQRIDLAVEDPYHRGRGLIAVETDGDRYAALRSTRDRDRLRPEQLARLGWIHERVWSTDVFRDPAREISRIVAIARETRPSGTAAEPATRPEREAAGTAAQTASAPDAAEPEAPTTSGGAGAADGAGAAGAPDPGDGEPRRRKRRRVFRRGTAETAAEDVLEDLAPSPVGGRSRDDTDLGWGTSQADEASREQWLQEQRPPHYE
jgi:very-short-patch-repair endonuclease